MFDAHNHLHFAAFDADREAVIERAAAAGVRGMVLAGYDSQRREVARDLAERPGIGATAGLHPWAIDDEFETQIDALEQLDWAGFCGIGELGLDWIRATSDHDRERQIAVFRRQLGIARDLNLPVVLHCVKANDELARWLRADGLPPRGGMVHSFWGSAQQAKGFLDLGLLLSVGPQLTYTQPKRIVDALTLAGLDRLLLETDAPSRPPASVDEKRSEPAMLPHIVRALAEVLDAPLQSVETTTTRNAAMLFESGLLSDG